jgi:hypothetical protein
MRRREIFEALVGPRAYTAAENRRALTHNAKHVGEGVLKVISTTDIRVRNFPGTFCAPPDLPGLPSAGCCQAIHWHTIKTITSLEEDA